MKKSLFLISIILSIIMCVSCEDEPQSGEAYYSPGWSSINMSSDDADFFNVARNAYGEAAQAVASSLNGTYDGHYIKVSGQFSKLDNIVVREYTKAEETISASGYTPLHKCTYEVTGAYIGTSISDKIIYTKTWQ